MTYLTVCLNPTLQKTLRFSAVAPDAVNRTGVHRLDASGKGINVSRVLTQLGKNVTHLTQLGGVMQRGTAYHGYDGAEAPWCGLRPLFLSLCEKDSLAVQWVESGSPIRFCYTLLNDSDSSVTELVEESDAVSAGTEQRLLERFEEILAKKDSPPGMLVVSGSKAAGFSDAVIPAMAQKAKERGLKIILDIRGNDLVKSLVYEPDIVKPNLDEFIATFAPEMAGNIRKEKVKEAALELCKKYRCRIILTRGADSLWAAEADNFFEAGFKPVKPLNTTGSGDAFTAGLAAALGDGNSFAAAIAEGARCGALNALSLRPGSIQG